MTVGLVALPLAMAFAIASGVPPQAGLYTAVVAGFLISALGGSRMQIGGPTGAFVVIVAGIVAKFGTSGLALVGIMAGVVLVIMGLTGLGTAVKFIPRPVIIGFTNGIALLIASTQIKDFLGLKTPPMPSEFLQRMAMLAEHIKSVSWETVALGAASLAIILLWPRVTRRVPGTILALLLATIATAAFHLHVETIGSKFGGFPHFEIPRFQAAHIIPLLPSVFTVALLAAIESLLSAVVADSMSGDRELAGLFESAKRKRGDGLDRGVFVNVGDRAGVEHEAGDAFFGEDLCGHSPGVAGADDQDVNYLFGRRLFCFPSAAKVGRVFDFMARLKPCPSGNAYAGR
jgi:sulfate permease, SulP family